jgi:hypothetical protein
MEGQLGADVPKDRLANLEPLIAAIASAELGEKRSPAVAGLRLPLVSVDWRYIGNASDCGHGHPQILDGWNGGQVVDRGLRRQTYVGVRRPAKLAKLPGAVLLAEESGNLPPQGWMKVVSAAFLSLRHPDAR